jgi:uncharacterized protein YecT (DUF1311 family)
LITTDQLRAQTQGEMNDSTFAVYQKYDAELNLVYKKLLNCLNENQKKMLIQAQKNWIKFRDSHCNFDAEENEGESIQPMVWAMCLEEVTKARIKDLKQSIISRGL